MKRVEVYPGDGSVLVSQGLTAHFFSHLLWTQGKVGLVSGAHGGLHAQQGNCLSGLVVWPPPQEWKIQGSVLLALVESCR